ncbi:MAG: RNase adapter RapZ [Alphaproteobacteria bacterium]|nr:RNase adapter RapZ [Alphaproteobacteria bacterium]
MTNIVPRILLVTGLSGAGRTTALKALEDIGYEAVDNMPVSLLQRFDFVSEENHHVAFGIDSRTRGFTPEIFIEIINKFRQDQKSNFQLLYLSCDQDVLARRYIETRRKHPLAINRPVIDGIDLEKKLLAPLEILADELIDTTNLTPGNLKNIIYDRFNIKNIDHPKIVITLISFSYHYGLPREADWVFDVRFLHNPFYQPSLKNLNGLDMNVAKYIERDSVLDNFFTPLTQILNMLLPKFEQEGKSYLTIAVGCTGGKHRSVYIVQKLADFFQKLDQHVNIMHRDIYKHIDKF